TNMALNDLDTTITKRTHSRFSSVLPVLFVVLISAMRTDAQVRSVPSRMAVQTTEQAGSAATGQEEGERLSQQPVAVFRAFGLPITNSMILSWMVALGLIIFVQVAAYKMKPIPSGAQNFLEWLVGTLYGFLEGLLGRPLVDRTFWFFATVFIFI